MAWDGVPWSVGGGAVHSPNVARLLAYAAFAGHEGIVRAKDLEVRELAVPGPQVRVFPGSCAIENRGNNALHEMYVGRLPTQDVVDITPTDSTGGRNDLVVARVFNPHWVAGEQAPDYVDAASGPYIETVVREAVGNNVDIHVEEPGWSAITLARIEIPASTATITQDMITDHRQLSHVRDSGEFQVIAPTSQENLGSTGYTNWPNQANFTVNVPSWATHAEIRALIAGVRHGGSGDNGGAGWNVYGDTRIQFGGGSNTSYSQGTAFNLSAPSGHDRATIMCGAPLLHIAENNRGKGATIRIEGRRSGGNAPDLYVDKQSMVSIEVRWTTRRESNM